MSVARDAETDPDADIVVRVLAGDIEAYRILVSRYRDRCLRYTYRMLGDMDDAEDVTQEAFVRAYGSLTSCYERSQFGAWLFRILVNRCRTAASRRGRRRKLFQTESLDSDGPLAQRVPQQPGVGVAHEVSEELDRALAQLNDAQREAFLLKYVDDMTYEEMAALTGTSVPALKMRVNRACTVLRTSLAEVYNAR